MNHTASTGYPGFDAVPGQTLSCESWMGAETYGMGHQPFGNAVNDVNDDLRLGSAAMNVIDFESFMVFDMFMTNKTIYAFYERLPFARGALGNYAAFSYQIPVASRTPGDQHHLKVSLDRAAGKVTWFVDGEAVHQVDNIGFRIDRKYMTLDHGGQEVTVSPRQLDCGMGTFTLLDGSLPNQKALVRLSDQPDLYFNPKLGAPVAQTFVDNASLPGSRLFGQGATLRVRRAVVSSRPAGQDDDDNDCH